MNMKKQEDTGIINDKLHNLNFGPGKLRKLKDTETNELGTEVVKLLCLYNAYEKAYDNKQQNSGEKKEELFLAALVVHLKYALKHKEIAKRNEEKKQNKKKGQEKVTTNISLPDDMKRQKKMEEEDEIRDMHNIVMNVTGRLEAEGSVDEKKAPREIFTCILQQIEEMKSSDVTLFPSVQTLFFVFGFYLLYGETKVIRALKKTKQELTEGDDTILGLMIYFLRRIRKKACRNTKDHIPKLDASFVKVAFKKFLYSPESCDIRTFRNFISDLIFLQPTITCGEIIPTYSELVYSHIKRKMEDRQLDITAWNDKKHELTNYIIPVLFQSNCSLSYFEYILRISKTTDKFLNKLVRHFREPNNQQKRVVRSKEYIDKFVTDAVLKKDVGQRNLVNVSRQLMFEVLEKLRMIQHHNAIKSVIQTVDDLPTTALQIAQHLQEREEKTFEILVVLEDSKKISIPSNGVIFKPFDHKGYEQFKDKKSVRYGTLSEMEKYLEKNKKAKNIHRFGILANIPNTRKSSGKQHSTDLVAISPVIIIIWIHARIIQKHLEEREPETDLQIAYQNERLKKMTSKTTKAWLEDQQKSADFCFDGTITDDHLKAALTSYLETDSMIDVQLKTEREAMEKMKNNFSGFWIHLLHAGQKPEHPKNGSAEKDDVHFHAIFPEFKESTPATNEKQARESRKKNDERGKNRKHRIKELTPIFTKTEDIWVSAIKHELNVNKDRAVLVLTSEENYDFLKKKLGNCMITCEDVLIDVEISGGQIVLLHTNMLVYVSTNSLLHVVSCALPRDVNERGILIGTTICREQIFTQRFILCEEYFSFDTKTFIRRAIPSDWFSKSRSLTNQIDDYLVNRNGSNENLWKFYELAKTILEKEALTGETIEDKIEHFYNILMLDRANLLTIVKNGIMNDGKWKAANAHFAGFLSKKLSAAEKHFTTIVNFRDVRKMAERTRKYRMKGNTHGETIIHYPGDPNMHCKGTQKEVAFRNRTAVHIDYNRDDTIRKISLLMGDFVFERYKETGQLLRHFHFGASVYKEVTICEQMNGSSNVQSFIKKSLKNNTEIQKFYKHHQQVYYGCGAGDIHTNPISELRVGKVTQQYDFEVEIENITSNVIRVFVSVSGQNANLFQIKGGNGANVDASDSVMVTGTYIGTQAISTDNIVCNFDVTWVSMSPSFSVQFDDCYKTLPIKFTI